MRLPFSAIAAILLAGTAAASAQGLSAIRSRNDFQDPQPMQYSAGVGIGYDKLNYKEQNANDINSAFIQGSLGASFVDKDKVTPWDLGLDFGTVYYLDNTNRSSDIDYSARVVFNIAHSFTERLKVVDNFYLTYEVQPDFGLGASTALRNGQYYYGYNNFAVSYAWSERFSTTTAYTVDGIRYEDSRIGASEDRFSHMISQQFSWAWNKTLKLVGEYRYKTVQYRNGVNDYDSHYILAGVDKAWSERTTGTFRAGAEIYKSQRTDKTAPYFEAALHHATSEKTFISTFASVGFDGSELGNYDSRYSYRIGSQITHNVSKKLSLNGGVNYAYSTFNGSGSSPDVSEHELSATAGIGYKIWDNVSIDANYSYTFLTSDDKQRDYDRNRVSLGLNATF
jgi:hypothetical protein